MPRSVTASGGVRLLSTWRSLHAFFKPPALSSEPDRRGGPSLLDEAAALLGVPPQELHVATRLDAMVSGVVVVAAGRDGARAAAALQHRGALERRYLALADGAPSPERGEWDVPIGAGPRGVPVARGRDARDARTRYSVVTAIRGSRATGLTALLDLAPETGRSHQLRIHAALGGSPLLGDVHHGGPRRLTLQDGRVVAFPRVFLHAYRIRAVPGADVEWQVDAPAPRDFADAYAALGGDPATLEGLSPPSPVDAGVVTP